MRFGSDGPGLLLNVAEAAQYLPMGAERHDALEDPQMYSDAYPPVPWFRRKAAMDSLGGTCPQVLRQTVIDNHLDPGTQELPTSYFMLANPIPSIHWVGS